MTVEIRTTSVKPIRHTFDHLAKRFGDKPATRYQEAAYDIQPTANFHYKPLWDPEHELYDERRTAVKLKDWYVLKDPRQFYYGNYTTTRAKQQEALDRQLEFVEKRDLLRTLPDATRDAVINVIVPLRHYEFGANLNNSHIAGYGFGTAITSAAMMNCMDRLGMAQHLSRIGLLVDGNSGESLSVAKTAWTDAPEWQGLRREMENSFVARDWFELFIAQNLVGDGLVYPLFFQQYDRVLAANNGTALSSLTDFLMRWYEETGKWVDATAKAAAAESAENKALLSGWTVKWRDAFVAALKPLAAKMFGDRADAVLAETVAAFNTRATKLGLSV